MLRFSWSIAALAALLPGSLRAEEAKAPIQVVAEGRQPQAAVEASGRVHVVYGLGNEIRHVVSNASTTSFGSSTLVGSLPKPALGMRRGPRVAIAGRAIVVVAAGGMKEMPAKGSKGVDDGDLFSWRSTDEGKSWSGPTRINSIAGSAREGLHGLAASADGSLYVVWLDLRSQTMEIYGARSTDGGATWTDEMLVYRSPDKAVCPCCHPSVAFSPDGTLSVMWRNQLFGRRDLFLTRSKDGGKTFGEAVKLGEGSWSFNACPMDGGAIAFGKNGSVDTVWMRESRVFAAEIGKPERSLGRGVQPWAASDDRGAYFAWLAARPGKLMGLRPGSSKPEVLASSAGDPMLASPSNGRGPVVAVWEVATESTPDASQGHGGHGPKTAGPIALSILSPSR